MDTAELNKRLLAIGESVKAKGWPTASIDIFVSYLAIFDRKPSSLDPMISCRPSLRASTRDKYGTPATHEFVKDAWNVSTFDQAIAKLEETAVNMPTMQNKTDRINDARAKLSDDERRLLGVR